MLVWSGFKGADSWNFYSCSKKWKEGEHSSEGGMQNSVSECKCFTQASSAAAACSFSGAGNSSPQSIGSASPRRQKSSQRFTYPENMHAQQPWWCTPGDRDTPAQKEAAVFSGPAIPRACYGDHCQRQFSGRHSHASSSLKTALDLMEAGKVMEMDQKNVKNLKKKPSKEAKILPLWETKSWRGIETAQMS